MKITYLGHASFALEHDGTTVLIDPWLTATRRRRRRPTSSPPTRSCSPTATPTTTARTRSRSPSAPARRCSRSSRSPRRSPAELGEDHDVRNPNFGGTVQFELGLGGGWCRTWHTSTTSKGTVTPPGGIVVELGGTVVYHLGDTALFSDLARARASARRSTWRSCRSAANFTMDRHDARRGGQAGRRHDRDPRPLQHVPADRDRRAGVQGRRRGGDVLGGRRPRPWGVLHAMTHAIVLIEAERDAMSTLGGVLADVEGRPPRPTPSPASGTSSRSWRCAATRIWPRS